MDLKKIRKETPGCHNKLFFNSAGSSLPTQSVLDHIQSYLDEEAQEGGYRMADKHKGDIAGFYQEAAILLNTKAKNIAFASSATEAYARALSAIPFQQGDVILTTDDDYVSSHLQFISLKKRYGVEIVRAPCLENGDLDLDQFEDLIKKHSPKLVALAHIPTSSGLIQDAEAVGDLCEKYECLYLVDACQSGGQIPLDVNHLKCDFLSVTGRKFLRGPRGTGFLYVSDHILNEKYAPLFVDLRGATWTDTEEFKLKKSAKRFEQWEMPYALMIGLKEAIGYANGLGLEEIEKRNEVLSSHIRTELNGLKGIEVFDKGSRKGSIVTFRKTDTSLIHHIRVLQENNVYFSISSKESALLDFTKKGVDKLIRISPHYFNTMEEIDDLIEIIATIQ